MRAVRGQDVTLSVHIQLRRLPLMSLLVTCACVVLTLTALAHQGMNSLDRAVDFGAKSNAAILTDGEWFRLITANLLHDNLFHLAFNCSFLLAFAVVLEGLYRHRQVAAMLMLAALATTLGSLLTTDAIACGASGLVAAVISAVLVQSILEHRLPKRLRYTIWLGGGPAAVLFLALSVFTVGVDHAGHVCGALIGAWFALWCPNRFATSSGERRLQNAFLAVAVLAGFGCLWLPPWRGTTQQRPADDVSLALPDSLSVLTSTERWTAYHDDLSNTWLIRTGDVGTSTKSFEQLLGEDLRRLRESEDVKEFGVSGPDTIQIGDRPATMLTLRYTGPRGPMVGRHVWVEGPHSWLHLAVTGRWARSQQNEERLRSVLSQLRFHSSR